MVGSATAYCDDGGGGSQWRHPRGNSDLARAVNGGELMIRTMATETLDEGVLEATTVTCEWQRCIFGKLMAVKTRCISVSLIVCERCRRLRGALWVFGIQQPHKGFWDSDDRKQT
uniref:Uncharacterized protein n=1 Tax=Oryza meridionalis TaxID=40149 RepID=A0A0E0E935_9ORYZ